MQSNPVEREGYLQVFIGAAIWGTIGFFVMVMSRYGSSAVLTSFLRLLFAALIMVALTGARYGAAQPGCGPQDAGHLRPFRAHLPGHQ